VVDATLWENLHEGNELDLTQVTLTFVIKLPVRLFKKLKNLILLKKKTEPARNKFIKRVVKNKAPKMKMVFTKKRTNFWF